MSSLMLNALKLATPIKIQSARGNWDDHVLLPRESFEKLTALVEGMETIANYDQDPKMMCWPSNHYMEFARALLDGEAATLEFYPKGNQP